SRSSTNGAAGAGLSPDSGPKGPREDSASDRGSDYRRHRVLRGIEFRGSCVSPFRPTCWISHLCSLNHPRVSLAQAEQGCRRLVDGVDDVEHSARVFVILICSHRALCPRIKHIVSKRQAFSVARGCFFPLLFRQAGLYFDERDLCDINGHSGGGVEYFQSDWKRPPYIWLPRSGLPASFFVPR